MSNLTTLLRVQVDTVFSSLDTLRRKSDAPAEQDDWKWVLRSSTATRTILQWDDTGNQIASNTLGAELPNAQRPRALVQVTNGALRPGSASNLPNAPATAVSYDQQLGSLGRMLVAGQMSYDRGASGSFAGVWLPSGNAGNGPETIFIWRQSKIGAEGMEFQGMRIDHTEQLDAGRPISIAGGRGISSCRNHFFGFFAASSCAIECQPGSGLDGHVDRCGESSLRTVGADGRAGIGDRRTR